MKQNKIVTNAVKVKNAVLLKTNEDPEEYSLVHYNHEVLTVRHGQVVYMYPVSNSTDTAIMQALDYLDITDTIEDYCIRHGVNRKELRNYFKNSGHKFPTEECKKMGKTELFQHASKIAEEQ